MLILKDKRIKDYKIVQDISQYMDTRKRESVNTFKVFLESMSHKGSNQETCIYGQFNFLDTRDSPP